MCWNGSLLAPAQERIWWRSAYAALFGLGTGFLSSRQWYLARRLARLEEAADAALAERPRAACRLPAEDPRATGGYLP